MFVFFAAEIECVAKEHIIAMQHRFRAATGIELTDEASKVVHIYELGRENDFLKLIKSFRPHQTKPVSRQHTRLANRAFTKNKTTVTTILLFICLEHRLQAAASRVYTAAGQSYLTPPKSVDGPVIKDAYIGDEMQGEDIVCWRRPLHQKIISDWDAMEKIWSYIFQKKLRVTPDQHRVLVTETPLNPKVNREKLSEIMFESFSVPAMYVAIPPVLALYASGRSTGVVLDVGNIASYAVPIYEGYALVHGIHRVGLGGRAITKKMKGYIEIDNYGSCPYGNAMRNDMKEKYGYVALNYDVEMDKYPGRMYRSHFVLGKHHPCDAETGRIYTLPDGRPLKICRARFRSPEILFDPFLVGSDEMGVQEAVINSVTDCDTDLWRPLLANVVMCGGSSMFRGMRDRLTREVAALCPPRMRVRVGSEHILYNRRQALLSCLSAAHGGSLRHTAYLRRRVDLFCPWDQGRGRSWLDPTRRIEKAWAGGSILASLSTFKRMWITKDEFKDVGPSILYRKCF